MSLWDRPNGPQTQAANSAGQSALNAQAAGSAVLPALQTIGSTAETVILDPQNSSAALTISLPPNTADEQTELDLVASGYIETTNSSTVTLKVYGEAGAIPTPTAKGTSIATSGAITQNSATSPFFLNLRLIYDSVSGKLSGWFEGSINNTVVARTALSAVLTGVSNVTSPVAGFLLTLTSSAADGTHLATINVQKFTVG